jgi:hypothetical protein
VGHKIIHGYQPSEILHLNGTVSCQILHSISCAKEDDFLLSGGKRFSRSKTGLRRPHRRWIPLFSSVLPNYFN